jgi:hypothetical protein
MPTIEILDGPPEWSGAVLPAPDGRARSPMGLCHPRWVGTPLARALYEYRWVQTVGDRHRYRYHGPWGRGYEPEEGEPLAGWDVVVVQEEPESGDPRKLWGSPVRVYAAPPGTIRPDPARSPEEQGWQQLDEANRLRRRPPAGHGRHRQQALARRMREGDPWVVDHWRRLAGTHGAAKDAEAELILDDIRRMVGLAKAARHLRALRPDAVVAWTSDPPFAGTTTYIPVIGNDLAAIPGMGCPQWVAMQDRVLLVVHPAMGRPWDAAVGSARVYGAPPGTPAPDPSVAPKDQGWTKLDDRDFLIAWLLHIEKFDV